MLQHLTPSHWTPLTPVGLKVGINAYMKQRYYRGSPIVSMHEVTCLLHTFVFTSLFIIGRVNLNFSNMSQS